MSSINENARTGAMSEVAVELDLLSLGFNVARPLAVARYDLIAERGGRMYRIQTKTGRIDGRSNALKASFDTPYTPDEIDVVAIVSDGVVYYVKATDLAAETTNVTIRFDEPREGSSAFAATTLLEFPFSEGGD